LGTGLKIHQFSLPQVHPPTSTVESFLETIKAKFEKEAMLSASLGQREQLATQQQFLRRQETAKAKALAQQTLSHAEAQSIRMALSAPIINIHPELYWQLSQLETLVEATEHLHKILLLQDANTTVQSLNLESNLEPELLDLNLETRLQ
jgi:regulator of protease activity HflC (stomatin/prohibitin superfamily)